MSKSEPTGTPPNQGSSGRKPESTSMDVYLRGHRAGYRDAIMDAADIPRAIGRAISKGSRRRAGPAEQGEQTAEAIERLKP